MASRSPTIRGVSKLWAFFVAIHFQESRTYLLGPAGLSSSLAGAGSSYLCKGGSIVNTVFVVLFGADCEGGIVQKVFANKSDAIHYINEKYSNLKPTGNDEWHTTFLYKGERIASCDYVCIEEWEVE